MTKRRLSLALCTVLGVLVLAAAAAGDILPIDPFDPTLPFTVDGAAPAVAPTGVPRIRHVFVIVLENENAATSFGPGSPAPYLARTLVGQGVFIPNYYGVTHLSLGNYVALVSGQGSNVETQADCQVFSDFTGTTVAPLYGQAVGQGCVYPNTVATVADQLNARGMAWKGYMEDMGKNPARESATCGHPGINAQDNTQTAQPQDQYAARHNPFIYFHSILDSGACDLNDVPLDRLPGDLAKVGTTASLTFITPNLCHDGHDTGCKNGEPGGLVSADKFLMEWVPKITASPAYRKDGLLLVTFDESATDGSACCNEQQFPNTPSNGGTTPGRGGGRVGAVALSPFIKPGTVTQKAYNHFSTLRTIEKVFGLPYLGYAADPAAGTFGADVFTAR